MTNKEIYKELQKLLDWHMRGKISTFQYEKRSKELENLLSTNNRRITG